MVNLRSGGSAPSGPDVVCVGILVADVIVGGVAALPPTGELAIVDEVELHSGGCAANTGVDLARLGLEVEVVGKVGSDAFGRFLIGEVESAGARAHGAIVDRSHSTSASVVVVDGEGERTFLHYLGANASLTEADLDPQYLFSGRALHLAGALLLPALDGSPLARIVARARQRGVMTSMSVAYDRTGRWDRVHGALPHLDLFMPNLIEARAISGEQEPPEIAAWLRERGVRQVAITLGPDGAYGASEEFEGTVRSPEIEVLDSTGAGDAFAAGALFGLLTGRSFEVALELGCACGALATTTIGATNPYLSAQTLMQAERTR